MLGARGLQVFFVFFFFSSLGWNENSMWRERPSRASHPGWSHFQPPCCKWPTCDQQRKNLINPQREIINHCLKPRRFGAVGYAAIHSRDTIIHTEEADIGLGQYTGLLWFCFVSKTVALGTSGRCRTHLHYNNLYIINKRWPMGAWFLSEGKIRWGSITSKHSSGWRRGSRSLQGGCWQALGQGCKADTAVVLPALGEPWLRAADGKSTSGVCLQGVTGRLLQGACHTAPVVTVSAKRSRKWQTTVTSISCQICPLFYFLELPLRNRPSLAPGSRDYGDYQLVLAPVTASNCRGGTGKHHSNDNFDYYNDNEGSYRELS